MGEYFSEWLLLKTVPPSARLREIWWILYRLAILQPLSIYLLDRSGNALPVIHLASVPTELKLILIPIAS